MAEDRDSECKMSPNFFVQQVIDLFELPSPQLLVRDAEQPKQGSLRRKRSEGGEVRPQEMREKALEVLKCKGLRNEELLPAGSGMVVLGGVGRSNLLTKRQARRYSSSS